MKKNTFGLMLISMVGAAIATIFTAKKLADLDAIGIHKWDDEEAIPTKEEEKVFTIKLDENDEGIVSPETVELEDKIEKEVEVIVEEKNMENKIRTRFICKMRKTPGPEGEVMFVIGVGEEITVLNEVKGWYEVFYAGMIGYVSKRGAVLVEA